MMPKKYIVDLTENEHSQLMKLVSSGKTSARKINRARILLLAAEGKTDQTIVDALKVGVRTVERTRQRFVEEGLQIALNDRPRPGRQPKLDGKGEVYLIALTCSDPPEGRERWTLQLLAGRLVEAGIVDEISGETVRQVLKKATSSPGASSSGAFPE
jgi:transposase